MVAQGGSGVFGAETARVLQQRHRLVDEVVEPGRGQVRHEDEPVAGVGLYVQIDLVGHLSGRADELLAAGDGDDQLADAEFLGLGAFAIARGDSLRVAVPYPALGDGGVVYRVHVGQWTVRVVAGEVTLPDLLEHGDRRRPADLLQPDVAGLVRRLGRGVAKHERRGRKHLERLGVSAIRHRAALDVGVVALTGLQRG